MTSGLPEIHSAFIIAPHPDDEALGCSGTIILLHKNGSSSTLVFITNGEKLYGEPSADIAQKRIDEAQKASEMLGCEETLFLGFPDGEIGIHTEKIYRKLSEVIEKKKPDIVFSPSPIDYHADHIATSYIAMKLFNGLRSFRLAFYEVYSTLRFSHLVDITELVEKKKQVISAYITSLYGKPEIYVSASLGLNAHRSLFVQKNGFYEAFYVIEKKDTIESALDYLCYKDIRRRID